MASRLADMIRRARRLAAERDRLIEQLAEAWADTLQGQGLSARDLEEFWAGLTEDAVRRAGRASSGKWPAQVWRLEAQEVVTRLRKKVEARLDGH